MEIVRKKLLNLYTKGVLVKVFFLFAFLTISILIFLKLRLKSYHPLMITFVIWTIVIALYHIVPSGLYPLTNNIYIVIFLYLFFFLMGSLFYYLVKGRKLKRSYYITIEEVNITSGLFYFVLFLSIYLLTRYLKLFLSGTTLYKEIVQGRLGLDLKILFYFDKLALTYFFYTISLKKITKKEKLFVLVFFLMTFLKFSKMDIMQLFVGTILALWMKKVIKLRHILLLSGIMFSIIVYIHLYRTKDNNEGSLIDGISRMLSIYFLSPLKAFDLLVSNEITFEKYKTFIFLERILERIFKISLNNSTVSLNDWVYVPFPTNVYTCLWRFYSDFKILGVIFFGYFLGFFWTYIFENTYKPIFQLIYISLFYILVFQFFSDILFGYTSQTIQIIFLTVVVYHIKNDPYFNTKIANILLLK